MHHKWFYNGIAIKLSITRNKFDEYDMKYSKKCLESQPHCIPTPNTNEPLGTTLNKTQQKSSSDYIYHQ